MKTTEEIILEIERRADSIAVIPSRHYTDGDESQLQALLSLLDWIKMEKLEETLFMNSDFDELGN